jgi:hypothetical protein
MRAWAGFSSDGNNVEKLGDMAPGRVGYPVDQDGGLS